MGGVCFDDEEIDPENLCQICDADADDQGWTSRPDGTACGDHGECQAGQCECVPGWAGGNCDTCVIFVDGSSTAGDADGLTWETAFDDLHDGMAAAAGRVEDDDAETCDVWVAAGLYLPGDVGEVEAAFEMAPGVHLYGGFAGSETERDQRDWDANPTTLSGDLNGSGTLSTTDNARTVMIIDGIDGAVISGFTITGGASTVGSETIPEHAGGGLYLRSTTVEFSHLIIEGNLAHRGGGIFGQSVSGHFHDLILRSNTCSGVGGGAHFYLSGELHFDELVVEGNGCTDSGIHNHSGELFIENAHFLNNASRALRPFNTDLALWNVDFTQNQGRALYQTQGTADLLNVTFTENQSTVDGGAYGLFEVEALLREVTFTENHSDQRGGAIFAESSEVLVVGGRFEENTSDGRGAAIYAFADDDPDAEESSIVLQNVYFVDNESGSWAGALKLWRSQSAVVNTVFHRNRAQGGGGGIYSRSSDLVVANSTFVGNHAESHPGAAVSSDEDWEAINTIFWGQTGTSIFGGAGDGDFLHCVLEGGGAGENIVTEDPLFTSDDDLRLQAGSPAIDAGHPTTAEEFFPVDDDGVPIDLAGNPRFVDTIDIGAYEVQ